MADFKLLRWMQNLHQSTWEHEILYADRFLKDKQLLIRTFLLETKKKYERGGRLEVKFHILFYRDNSRTVTLRQMKFGAVKDHEHTWKHK
jgi:predicted nucleotidyltransferase